MHFSLEQVIGLIVTLVILLNMLNFVAHLFLNLHLL